MQAVLQSLEQSPPGHFSLVMYPQTEHLGTGLVAGLAAGVSVVVVVGPTAGAAAGAGDTAVVAVATGDGVSAAAGDATGAVSVVAAVGFDGFAFNVRGCPKSNPKEANRKNA